MGNCCVHKAKSHKHNHIELMHPPREEKVVQRVDASPLISPGLRLQSPLKSLRHRSFLIKSEEHPIEEPEIEPLQSLELVRE